MRQIHNLAFGESPVNGTAPQEVAANNLYLTFWYSQGQAGLDASLTELTQDLYAHNWSDAEWQTARQHVGKVRDPAFLQLGMPRTHIDPRARGPSGEKVGNYQEIVSQEFEQRWRSLGYAFNEDRAMFAQNAETRREDNLRRAEDTMIYCDYRYNTGRKRRFSSNGDQHQSMYRTFVLEGRPTGSEEFDTIFAELRRRFVENGPPDRQITTEVRGKTISYSDMVDAWKANHPSETAYEPQDPETRLGLLRGSMRKHSKIMAGVASLPLSHVITTVRDRFRR